MAASCSDQRKLAIRRHANSNGCDNTPPRPSQPPRPSSIYEKPHGHWTIMVQRKRTAGSAPPRRSARGQKAPEDETDSNDADIVKSDLPLEEPQPTPRKRARTRRSGNETSLTREDDPEDELMADINESTDNATNAEDVPEERDAASRTKFNDNIASANEDPARAESPTTEVSLKLGSVDIETPRRQTPSTRSTRSKGKGRADDTDMLDELSTIVTGDSIRRSGRARKTNPIYDEDKFLDAAEKQLQIPPTKSRPARKADTDEPIKSSPKGGGKGAKTGPASSHHLLTNKRSRLVKAEANMIFNENTWGLFTEEEKLELLSLLHPIDTEITNPEYDHVDPPPRIPTPDLFRNLNNDAFRSAFAELQDDLATGSYEPNYVKKAEEALRQRLGPMSDKVDNMKNKEFEEFWGQKQAVFYGDAGAATNISLYELCQRKIFKPGDMFEYKRTFSGSKSGITVEKVCELESVELAEDSPTTRKKKEACTMTFRYGAGTRKYPLGKLGDTKGEGSEKAEQDPDVILEVNTLAQLEFAILDEDGTVKASDPVKFKKYPSGNAWKTFMVRRNDEFLGSTFVMRQDYYEKTAAAAQD
ncbi:hypothetical protein ABW21_db0202234 [Orbilia brochopaga]|nr:hypothetical protein ABW21_db0202234 [Drechslerella brochopaga]